MLDPMMESELLARIDSGEINLREALGLDLSILGQLVDKAFGLIDAGKALQGDALLSDLCEVMNLSFTLPFALGAARETRRDWFGAIEAYSEALTRAERLEAPESFVQEGRMARARSLLSFGRLGEARQDLENVLRGPNDKLVEVAKTWLANDQEVRNG
jgi:hypothetical protein